MKITPEAKIISRISRDEIGLLYQPPNVVQTAINEDRTLIIREGNVVVAFCLWRFLNSQWCEITTLYVAPAYRKKGYFVKIVEKLRNLLSPKIRNAVMFSRHPAVAKVMIRIGFKPISFFSLTPKIFLNIVLNRLHPLRIVSYLKFLKLGIAIFQQKFQTYVYQKPTD